MSEIHHDAVGIGNAIVDVIANADEAFLIRHGLAKGGMTLIDEARAESLYAAMAAGIESSGGSAANTIAALASLGGTGGFIGKVRDDTLGKVFAHDIRAGGIAYVTAPATDGKATARCLIFVTPDAQRTMQTFLGASIDLGPDDIQPEMIAQARYTYLEGYLWDPPECKKAFLKAAKIAHDAGRKVALSLSDAFCVERHRADFLDLVTDHVDVLFANEAEITSLFQAPNFDEALQKVRGRVGLAALTRSEKGSVIVAGDDVHVVDAIRQDRLVDTTGAGDAYAAGFLFGLARGRTVVESARIGGLAAAEVISHFGARPKTPLRDLLARHPV